jgi:DNA-binding NarL/FixJ family response regulator
LADAPATNPDILLVDWNLLPSAPAKALGELRRACSTVLVIVLISQPGAREQAAFSVGADAFISKYETPENVAANLQTFAERMCTGCGPA